MSMPRVVSEIDRLQAALKLANARNLDLVHEREDLRAQRDNYLDLSVTHAEAAAKSAKELREAISEIDGLQNQVDNLIDENARLRTELEER